jgi:hypothetical protein
MKQKMRAVQPSSLHQGMRIKNKKKAQKTKILRTWVASKSESVNRCSDNEADSDVEVADDYFDAGKNFVVSSKSKRVVCMCCCGKR